LFGYDINPIYENIFF